MGTAESVDGLRGGHAWSWTRTALAALAVFAADYAAAKLGLALRSASPPSAGEGPTVLWPANAVLLTALLVAPQARWWAIFPAALLASCLALPESNPTHTSVLFATDAVQSLVVAALLRRAGRGL